ncbi:carbonic anhydrase [Streptomyces sp. 1114.5]|uniref:carbonic anhydrase n=1 Tax=unclassified Streptomyces TaxID=2593676 RepID=UPI000BCF2117|nr:MULTISPECIES: carbonic anhydrase [unclassified Streptomyces]RKT19842.1 carbonic anhydrase [Streptomyces sp. 1114.5]SOB86041.1 carbonic anhydrase [Streptomyces sp. 1331.2]
MQAFIDHARTFRRRAAQDSDAFGRLAAGQNPQALFITCSDSRVIPAAVTGARPGDLFEMRTAGNIVPPYRPDVPSAEAATIEYAVEVLEIADIVVCGHSHCGAVGAVVRGDDLTGVPAVRDWLADGTALTPDGEPSHDLAGPVQRHVLDQLQRLRTHPSVARRIDEGRLGLHGWFYEVHTGAVHTHRPGTDVFLPL